MRVGSACRSVVVLGLLVATSWSLAPAEAGIAEGDVRWIVALVSGVDPTTSGPLIALQHGGNVEHVYTHALRGFSFIGSPQAAAALGRDPRVRSIVADRSVAAFGQVLPTGVDRVDADLIGAGAGDVDIDIAILDTGVDIDHPDLNVVGGKNCTSEAGYDDGNGHGTHVAGTAAARDNNIGVVGVAPGARVWAVKVLDSTGSGSLSSVICGIDWVTANASIIEVANMSLGGSGNKGSCTDGGLNEAICTSVSAGVVYTVAAGNDDVDAAGFVPAAYDEVITVSALADFDGKAGSLGTATCRSDIDDSFADFSNYGAVVDLIAPGVCIRSTYKGGGYATLSGTSMASPHVAGAAALYLAANPAASPLDVKTGLQSLGNLDWNADDDPDGIKEKLLNVAGIEATGPAPDNAAPAASFSASCAHLTCTLTDTSTDSDGTVDAWTWTVGDGNSSTSQHLTHTYAAGGTYTATLTVADDDGATASTSTNLAVAAPADTITPSTALTSAFVPLASPQRLFDTRANGDAGYVRPGETITKQVTGHVGVPSTGVTAVVLNVTGVASGGAGFVTVWPTGAPLPNASSLNFTATNQARPNLVLVPIGTNGSVSFYSQSGVHLIADVAGYFRPAATAKSGRLNPLTPQRLLDTRAGIGAAPAKPGRETILTLQATGRAGVPTSGVAAVVMNVTATDATAPGYVTVWPTGQPRPNASNLNLEAAHDTNANLVIVPVETNGQVNLFTEAGTHLLADVVGWFGDTTQQSSTSGLFVTLSPSRVFDTRPTSFVSAGTVITRAHTGVAGIPLTGVSAVSLNVTGTNASSDGFITGWPQGQTQPNASTLNLRGTDDTRPNAAILPLSPSGAISYYSDQGTHLLADTTGYFTT